MYVSRRERVVTNVVRTSDPTRLAFICLNLPLSISEQIIIKRYSVDIHEINLTRK